MSAFAVFLFLSLWELAGNAIGQRSGLLPAPTRIVTEIWRQMDLLGQNALATCTAALLGLLAAAGIAALEGLAAFTSAGTRKTICRASRHIPRVPLVALAPLLTIWFGFNLEAKIAVAALFAAAPMLGAVAAGIGGLPSEFWEWLRSVPASRKDRIVSLYVPAWLGFLSLRLEFAVVLALSGALVGELISADRGLGYLLVVGTATSDAPFVFATVVVILAAAALLLVAARFVELWAVSPSLQRRSVTRWQR
jgi:ABC-type nitrate/sulfonate/bicarbonate transport system permease component